MVDQVRICNVAGAAHLSRNFKLEEVARKLSNITYVPGGPGAYIRLREPQAVLKLHRSGSVTLFGAKSPRDVGRAFRALKKKLEREGNYRGMVIREERITNVMGVGKFAVRGVNLEMLNRRHGHRRYISYEPELFSAVKYQQGKRFINLFCSAKFVFSGYTRQTMEQDFQMDLQIVEQHVRESALKGVLQNGFRP